MIIILYICFAFYREIIGMKLLLLIINTRKLIHRDLRYRVVTRMKPKASTILDMYMYTNPSNRSHHILWKENRQFCNILHVTTQQCKKQTNKQTNPTAVP